MPQMDVRHLVPFVTDYTAIEGKATAYVCVNAKCLQPTTYTGTMLALLERPA